MIPVWWTLSRTQSSQTDILLLSVFAGFVVYSPVHKYVLAERFRPERAREEEKKRPLRMANAVSAVTSAISSHRGVPEASLGDAERSLLVTIKSEVEAAIGDTTGAYLMANLLIPDPVDESKLRVIRRTDFDRRCPASYDKADMHAWKAIHSGRVVYVPDYKDPAKEYRSILCFPLYFDDGRGGGISLGAVTIDHSENGAFDFLETKLTIQLSPYLRMLELCLMLQRRA